MRTSYAKHLVIPALSSSFRNGTRILTALAVAAVGAAGCSTGQGVRSGVAAATPGSASSAGPVAAPKYPTTDPGIGPTSDSSTAQTGQRPGDERSASSPVTAEQGAPPTYRVPVTSPPLPATCTGVPARATPRADRPRYTGNIALDPAAGRAGGGLAVHFTPDLPTDRLVFRLWPNGPNSAAVGVHLSVAGFLVDGVAPASVTLPDATTVVVSLGRTLAAGQSVDASLGWAIALGTDSGDRVSHVGDTARLGSFLPLLAWVPGTGWALDPPTTAHGEASTFPHAIFDLGVSIPAGLTVLGTGLPATGASGGASGATVALHADAVPDIGLSIGRFRIASGTTRSGVPVTVGVAPGIAEDPGAYLAKAVAVVDSFGPRFGAYPWPNYTLAITSTLKGGIEYPGHVMQGPGSIGRTTSHEIGHEYFYALVVNDQGRDPWIDEALATWAEAAWEQSLASLQAKSIPADAVGRAGLPMTYWDGHSASYYRGVYVQGTQALARLGTPAAVDCALAEVVARYAYKIVGAADVVAVFRARFPSTVDSALHPAGLG